MKKALLAVALIAAIVSSYALGRRHARHDVGNAGRRVLYWVDPMHPAYRSDKPGIAPDCGMQLEPVYADGAGAGGAAVSGANLPDGTVNIDTARQQLIGMHVVPVENGAGAQTLRLLGRVSAEDTRVYRVSSAVEGWVRETFDDSVGAAVKKDQRLAMFYSPDFVTFRKRLSGGNRAGNEPDEGIRASVQYSADRLRVLGMSEAQINEIGTTGQCRNSVDVVSPTDGFIVARNISAKGMRFERQTEFYQIADLSHVWIIAEIFENEAQYFRPGVVAQYHAAGPAEDFLGAHQQCPAAGGSRDAHFEASPGGRKSWICSKAGHVCRCRSSCLDAFGPDGACGCSGRLRLEETRICRSREWILRAPRSARRLAVW